ncbi:MAG: tetrathionate reductase family octaheme c-type cytochrome, partial [Acidobacteria bacterium]|nr:tetrathionate reductase family octaheme c-type cytochrome [Acidobacteriota bacterium]
MRLIPLFLVTVAIFGVLVIGSLQNKSARPDGLRDLKARLTRTRTRVIDHAKLPQLQRTFTSGREVTEACISCHTERAKEVMQTSHWNWSRQEYIPGRGIRSIGKKDVLNNFCIGVSDNQEGCSKCHTGYGMENAAFDFNDPRNVDCLVCHDTTDTYAKGLAGMPSGKLDLKSIAQRVGRPSKSDCGACHFDGGGGNNVKHGDLEQGLLTANREVDVHMAADGAGLDCVACHTGENHRIRGRLYSVSSMNRDRVRCEQCHGEAPHEAGVLNAHTAKVACQTCHIPEYAKVNETKLTWDWSTAGRLRNGKPYEQLDAAGNPQYASIKGTFTWGRNVKPEYVFFNGTATHYLLGDKVPPGRPVRINALGGSYDDPDAKITPVKIHRGRQIYDPVTNLLIQPKLFSREKGDGGFWKDFNWNRAAAEGMKASGLPYSGHYEFVDTVMYWPVNHMVAPKEKSVGCAECHTPNHSRLAGFPKGIAILAHPNSRRDMEEAAKDPK